MNRPTMVETKLIDNFEDIQQCDVLLGRGTLYSLHIGSIAFKVAVASRLDAYLKATSQKAKTRLTWDIMYVIRRAGGRFLSNKQEAKTVQRSNTTTSTSTPEWYEVNSKVARVKIRDVFRDCIKSIRKENRPSLLLDELGLLGHFGQTSTFSEIVQYVAASSTVHDYTCIRKDIIEERKQKRLGSILLCVSEETWVCDVGADGSVVKCATYSPAGLPPRSSFVRTLNHSSQIARGVLTQREGICCTSRQKSQVDSSAKQVVSGLDLPSACSSSLLCSAEPFLLASKETDYHSATAAGVKQILISSVPPNKNNNVETLLPAAHDLSFLPPFHDDIRQPCGNASNEGGSLEKQLMTLFNTPMLMSSKDDTNPCVSPMSYAVESENSASCFIDRHGACATSSTRDEVLETALLLSHENDANVLFDYCLEHWNDLECTTTIFAAGSSNGMVVVR